MQTQHGADPRAPERKPAAIPESIDETLTCSAGRLCRRPGARDRPVPGAATGQAAVSRRRGRRRQDRGRQGAGGLARPQADSPPMLRGPRCRQRGLRMELSRADDGDQAGRGRRRTRAAASSMTSSRSAISSSARCSRRWSRRRGAPVLLIDETRPRRRGLRSLSARDPVGLPGDDSGNRHHHGAEPPIVVITSNRTREIHDALKRRCLYHWVGYPDLAARDGDRPRQGAAGPGAADRRTRRIRADVCAEQDLFKSPGVAETLDWAAALAELDAVALDPRRSPIRSAYCSNTRTTSPRSRARRQSSSSTKCSRNCARMPWPRARDSGPPIRR